VPKEAKIIALKNFHWVGDAHFMCVPTGLSAEKMAVMCDLMSFMMLPAQQALTFDKGYFYPAPAVKGVTLSMAPQESQDAINEYGRAEYAALIENVPMELPLDADKMVYAFRRWDEQVGSKVAK
jgi:putative spermidine/putrescine transport system substrate-binding protein